MCDSRFPKHFLTTNTSNSSIPDSFPHRHTRPTPQHVRASRENSSENAPRHTVLGTEYSTRRPSDHFGSITTGFVLVWSGRTAPYSRTLGFFEDREDDLLLQTEACSTLVAATARNSFSDSSAPSTPMRSCMYCRSQSWCLDKDRSA